ncbi:MAG: spore maturation protein [Clostridia bacterium]|nr:spore maturation protein [Clostridia bacterium]
MKYVALIIPVLFLALFAYALFKKVKLYDCFTAGIKEAAPLVLSLFPYLAAILILSELFEQSGLSGYLTAFLSPAFRVLGIPPEISKLVLLKPFSGSGSTALLSEILAEYGADSYIARCACVAYGSSETVFYILAVYFAGIGKRRIRPVVISLFAGFASVILGCFLCRFL